MSDEEEAEIEALRQALQQEREQIDAFEIEDPKEEDLAKGIMVAMRGLEPEAAAIFLERLRAYNVPFEEMIVPDEAHDVYLYRNSYSIARATVGFLLRKLRKRRAIDTHNH